MISEVNFVTAAFIDNERTNIEVLLKNDEETKVYPYILEYNPDNPICKELLEICSLDQIHENTWEKKKEEVKKYHVIKNLLHLEEVLKSLELILITEMLRREKCYLRLSNRSDNEVER